MLDGTAENAPAVAEICRRLDGLPLAIELAATRIRLFPPQALLDRLSKRLDLLTGGSRDLPARQQTIRSTIDWSYQLLDPPLQLFFSRLGALVGSWTLDAVAAADGRSTSPPAIVEGVGALLDQGLVKRADGSGARAAREPRFTMLETIREYAIERLAACGEEEAVRRHLAAHFLSLAEEAERGATGPDEQRWLDHVEEEHENLRAVVDWALDGADPEVGARIALAAGETLGRRGRRAEVLDWYRRALAHGPMVAAPRRAELLCAVAGSYVQQGQLELAEQTAAEGLALARAGGDKRALGRALLMGAELAGKLSDLPRAATLIDEAIGLLEAADDMSGLLMAVNERRVLTFLQGDMERSYAQTEEQLALARRLGRPSALAAITNVLGEWARLRSEYARAADLYEQSVSLYRKLDVRSTASLYPLYNLGYVRLRQGRPAAAAAAFCAGLRLAWESEEPATSLGHGIGGAAGAAHEVRATPQAARDAARLLSAALLQWELVGSAPEPVDLADLERLVARARTQLDEQSFAAAWAEGRVMPLDRAVADALRLGREVAEDWEVLPSAVS